MCFWYFFADPVSVPCKPKWFLYMHQIRFQKKGDSAVLTTICEQLTKWDALALDSCSKSYYSRSYFVYNFLLKSVKVQIDYEFILTIPQRYWQFHIRFKTHVIIPIKEYSCQKVCNLVWFSYSKVIKPFYIFKSWPNVCNISWQLWAKWEKKKKIHRFFIYCGKWLLLTLNCSLFLGNIKMSFFFLTFLNYAYIYL